MSFLMDIEDISLASEFGKNKIYSNNIKKAISIYSKNDTDFGL